METTSGISEAEDLARCAIRSTIHEICSDDRAPEGIEFFRWVHIPWQDDEAMVMVEDDSDTMATQFVTVQAIATGKIGFCTFKGVKHEERFWIGWDKYERVGVISCGGQYYFDGQDPRE